MKKNLVFLICSLSISVFSTAQNRTDTIWRKGCFTGINFSEVGLSNWSGGGENSISLAGSLNMFANYAKGKDSWDNSFDLNYAILKSGNGPARKSDDRIDLSSKYGRKFSDHWYYGILTNFKSQATNGYNYPDDSNVISKFLAPAYIVIAGGFDFKPNENFSAFISPVAGKFTIVADDKINKLGSATDANARYGVDSGQAVKAQLGAFVNIKFKKDIFQNVSLSTKLDLFDNYTDKIASNRKNVDINWEVLVNLKVNKYITASIGTQMVYDNDVLQRMQFKQTIGVGFGMKFAGYTVK